MDQQSRKTINNNYIFIKKLSDEGSFHQDVNTSKCAITPSTKWEQVKVIYIPTKSEIYSFCPIFMQFFILSMTMRNSSSDDNCYSEMFIFYDLDRFSKGID